MEQQFKYKTTQLLKENITTVLILDDLIIGNKFLVLTAKNTRNKQKKVCQLLYDPVIPLLGIYLNELKTRTQISSCMSIFTVALFTPVKCPL
jgi:hypothetical protein